MNQTSECNALDIFVKQFCFFVKSGFMFSICFHSSLREGDTNQMKQQQRLLVSAFRTKSTKRQQDLMNAIKSIAPTLLTLKIESPSITQWKSIFLNQKKMTNYPKDRIVATWEPKYLNIWEDTSAFCFLYCW